MAMDKQSRYSLMIEWSDEDQLYIASFPEWEARGLLGHTHGDTYEEAARNGEEVLYMLVRSAREEGEILPPPRTFDQSHPTLDAPAPAPALP